MQFCKFCGAQLEDGHKFCDNCGAMVPVDSNSKSDDLFGKMDDSQVDPAVLAERERIKQARELRKKEEERAAVERQNSLSSNYLLGFVGALLGGLVGAIPWVIISSFGWFVAWLGYLIALTASYGYDLMKVKLNKIKFWCVFAAVIISVFVGQIASDMISIAKEPELSGMFSEIFAYYSENFSEYLSLSAGNMFLGLLFAGLGSIGVLAEIKKEDAKMKELMKKEDI